MKLIVSDVTNCAGSARSPSFSRSSSSVMISGSPRANASIASSTVQNGDPRRRLFAFRRLAGLADLAELADFAVELGALLMARRQSFVQHLIDLHRQQFIHVARQNVRLQIDRIARRAIEQIRVLLSVLNE